MVDEPDGQWLYCRRQLCLLPANFFCGSGEAEAYVCGSEAYVCVGGNYLCVYVHSKSTLGKLYG